MLAVILLQVLGALGIDASNALLDVSALRQALPQAQNALFMRRVNEDVKCVRLVLQNALRAAADDDAVAIGISLFDDLLRNLHHLFGIEDRVVAKLEPGGQRG